MGHEVTRETTIPGSPPDVWRALVESDWLGERPEVLELEPGGDLRVGDREGFVEEVEPGKRLSFWWGEEGEESTRVEITLEPCEEGTVVVVEETQPLAVLGAAPGPQLAAVA